jgi:hypothetical protein
MWQPLLLSAACIPALILLAVVSIDRYRRKRQGEKPALSEKLLRPAGYSLQHNIEDLDNSFMTWFMGTFLFSLGAIGAFASTPSDVVGRLIWFIILGICAASCAIVAWRKLNKIRNCRRGLVGELAVAEELRRLLAYGYQVFHDIPGNGDWNVDHVTVGPAGVFAIETKYRTRKPGRNGARNCDATFDGNRIEFASGEYDVRATGQARENARWLANFLSKAIGERVTTQPIVALPGWFMTLKANSDVKVLSGKQIFNFISNEPVRLSDKVIKQISYQLDQRCRDVEI